MYRFDENINYYWNANFDKEDYIDDWDDIDWDEIKYNLKNYAIDKMKMDIENGYYEGELFAEVYCCEIDDYLSFSGWWSSHTKE